MEGNQTFTILKPETVERNLVGSIIAKITENGFSIRALKLTKLKKEQAEAFYAIHKGKEFYERLIRFMTAGPIVVAILEKDNAVKEFRQLIGTTNPAKADEGTIRHLYGENTTLNAIHGSDSDENAMHECDFFFSQLERF